MNPKVWFNNPLRVAAWHGHKDIVELLIIKGADVNASFIVNTPLDAAIENNQPETADLLRKHGAKSGVELSIHGAAREGNIEAVKQYLTAGADVNAKAKHGYTPLLGAAWGGHKEIAELLITKGADVNAKNNDGVTPLLGAAEEGHKEVVELLIAKGADVNGKDDVVGWTPLDWAEETNNKETAELLRKHGGKTSEELKAEGK